MADFEAKKTDVETRKAEVEAMADGPDKLLAQAELELMQREMQKLQVQANEVSKKNAEYAVQAAEKLAAAEAMEVERIANLAINFTEAETDYDGMRAVFETAAAAFEAIKQQTTEGPDFEAAKMAFDAAETAMNEAKARFDNIAFQKQEQDALDYERQQREAREAEAATA